MRPRGGGGLAGASLLLHAVAVAHFALAAVSVRREAGSGFDTLLSLTVKPAELSAACFMRSVCVLTVHVCPCA